jgi:hypothetical protein
VSNKEGIMNKLIIIIALLALPGCRSEMRVYSDYDPEYDLRKYHTFNWSQNINVELGKNPLQYNELNDKRIKSAVQEQMIRRGYVSSTDKPDLVLHYHIIIDDQSIVTTDPHGYFYSPYWMDLRTNVYEYREGTLIIDVMDPKTNNLIWRGWAASALQETYSPDQIEGLIKTAVAKIFRKFPKKRKN